MPAFDSPPELSSDSTIRHTVASRAHSEVYGPPTGTQQTDDSRLGNDSGVDKERVNELVKRYAPTQHHEDANTTSPLNLQFFQDFYKSHFDSKK